MHAEYRNAEGTAVALHDADGLVWAVPPEDPRLAGVEIAPYPIDVGAVIHAVFAAHVAAGLPVAGRNGAVALDPDSRRELTAAAVMASLDAWPAEGFWRLSDNTSLPLGRAQVMALGKVAAARYQTLFAMRSLLLDAVAAGQDVDPADGWPETEAFDPAG